MIPTHPSTLARGALASALACGNTIPVGESRPSGHSRRNPTKAPHRKHKAKAKAKSQRRARRANRSK